MVHVVRRLSWTLSDSHIHHVDNVHHHCHRLHLIVCTVENMLHLSPPSACCPPPTRQRQKNEEAAATCSCTTPPRGDLCTQRALIAAEHRFVLASILHQCHALAFSSAARDPVPQDDASYSSWSPSAACASKGHLQQLALRRVTANGRVHEPDARPVFECNVNTKMDTSTCTMHTLRSVHNRAMQDEASQTSCLCPSTAYASKGSPP